MVRASLGSLALTETGSHHVQPEFATLTTDDLVTGEAVALDLPAASLGSRIESGLIDLVVTLLG